MLGQWCCDMAYTWRGDTWMGCPATGAQVFETGRRPGCAFAAQRWHDCDRRTLRHEQVRLFFHTHQLCACPVLFLFPMSIYVSPQSLYHVVLEPKQCIIYEQCILHTQCSVDEQRIHGYCSVHEQCMFCGQFIPDETFGDHPHSC